MSALNGLGDLPGKLYALRRLLAPRMGLTAECTYCGEPCRDRGRPNVCSYCSDLPDVDPLYMVLP